MRATESDVKAIIDTNLTEEEVTPFLMAANVMVTRATRVAGAGTYPVDELRETERWLAAWLLASRDPRVKAETIGDSSATYDVESYWDRVIMLDPTGQLGSMKETKVSVNIEAY